VLAGRGRGVEDLTGPVQTVEVALVSSAGTRLGSGRMKEEKMALWNLRVGERNESDRAHDKEEGDGCQVLTVVEKVVARLLIVSQSCIVCRVG
jgi:hypothetical protein